jgi:hypothetical protein
MQCSSSRRGVGGGETGSKSEERRWWALVGVAVVRVVSEELGEELEEGKWQRSACLELINEKAPWMPMPKKAEAAADASIAEEEEGRGGLLKHLRRRLERRGCPEPAPIRGESPLRLAAEIENLAVWGTVSPFRAKFCPGSLSLQPHLH